MGLSGIGAEDGRHALAARSAEGFANAVCQVLTDRSLARQLASHARALIEDRYDWARITSGYLRLLTEARRLAKTGS
jgi:glycosyltransferase involved in cell wall biosynthesis